MTGLRARQGRWYSGGEFEPPDPATLDSVVPDSAHQGDTDDLVLTGTNFIPGDQAYLDDNSGMTSPRSLITHLNSSTELIASAVLFVETAGDYFVAVKRGSVFTAALPFTILAPVAVPAGTDGTGSWIDNAVVASEAGVDGTGPWVDDVVVSTIAGVDGTGPWVTS